MSKRRIAVLTGTRADYGHLFWLLKEIEADPKLTLQLIVTGSHLSDRHGRTVNLIEADGFEPASNVDLDLSDDSDEGVARSLGLAITGVARSIGKLKPDILVLLGDRYEVMGAAQAAMLTRTPIAHVHGGESSEGLIDEAIRHSVTKMAHLHYVAAEPYRKRVIQLGEDPSRVMNFGAPGLDHLTRSQLLTRLELESRLGFKLGERFFLVTYHPVTLQSSGQEGPVLDLLAALSAFPDAKLVFTSPNADPENSVIGRLLNQFVQTHPQRACMAHSLGQLAYLSALKEAAVVVGNSSSGIIEAPALKTPTVNVGDRQRGRIRAESVIDCGESREAIEAAIRKALSEPFRKALPAVVSPYGSGNASSRIKQHLAQASLEGILMKRFHAP